MLPKIPILADYGISAKHGFLPTELPLARLPDPYYNKWEAIAANLQVLILSRRLRDIVDRLPVLSTTGLEHEAEWRRAYSILCFMAHGYIWGGDSPRDRLPPPITVPLLEIAAHLEVPPVATYAAVCLWNFKPLFSDEGIDQLENLATLSTMTGSLDESWFYLVSVAMEARGGPMLAIMLKAIAAVREDDVETVTDCLCAFAERLDDLGMLLQRMHEQCDPNIFYHRIRPFLAGSKNMADAGLPHGVIYDTGNPEDGAEYRQYSGGSNAQSSLIQFFDIVLGVEHFPTGDSSNSNNNSDDEPATARLNFILEMRKYMPGPHARFLRDVSAVANIRPYVLARQAAGTGTGTDRSLAIAYDACLAMLRALRDKHIAIVTRYIVVPSRDMARAHGQSQSPETAPRRANATATAPGGGAAPRPKTMNLALASAIGKLGGNASAQAHASRLKGTGGTALISFLKQARDETGEPAVEEWTQRLLNPQGGGPRKPDVVSGTPKESLAQAPAPAGGLAGAWTGNDDVGGLCSY